jgi:hypothetical protein
VPADVLFQLPDERAGELAEVGIGRHAGTAGAREGQLEPAQQVDIGAMIGVERLAHLAHIMGVWPAPAVGGAGSRPGASRLFTPPPDKIEGSPP